MVKRNRDMMKLVLGLLFLFCGTLHAAPCSNCSDITPLPGDIKEEKLDVEGHRGGKSNLAWLVTPSLFVLGIVYFIYKCCRDGLCNCKRLRRRAAEMREDSSGNGPDHGYIPLSQVALYSSSHVPVTHPDAAGGVNTTRRILLVHNRTYCVTVDRVPGATGAASRRIMVQPLKPPTYEESLAQGNDSSLPLNPPTYTASDPPCYRIAMGEITPAPSLEDHIALESVLNALENEDNDLPAIEFTANRRRHRSAQDAHARGRRERQRHLSAQERRHWARNSELDGSDTNFRPRCFSFSALKDAFRRGSLDIHERESLLNADDTSTDNGSDEVLDTINVVSIRATNTEPARTHLPKSTKRTAQVSFEDRVILEDSAESSEGLDTRCQQTAPVSTNIAHLRQRHYSAPESSIAKSQRARHKSETS